MIFYFFCALLCLFSPALDAVQRAPKPISSKEIETIERKIIEMINNERAKKKLPPLRAWSVLTLYARNHSQNMADMRVGFGHEGFKERGEAINSEFPWTKFGENVACSYKVKNPLAAIIKGWMSSQKHRQNILEAYEETGVGVAFNKNGTLYITQLFATRAESQRKN
jgi:uncharacterized protein YkwD